MGRWIASSQRSPLRRDWTERCRGFPASDRRLKPRDLLPRDLLPREFRLATACALWPHSEYRVEAIRREVADGIDWTRFLRVATRQRILGLAYDGLIQARIAAPAALLETLRHEALAMARQALAMTAEAVRLRRGRDRRRVSQGRHARHAGLWLDRHPTQQRYRYAGAGRIDLRRRRVARAQRLPPCHARPAPRPAADPSLDKDLQAFHLRP